jgi:hypothetical protein
MIWIKCSYQNAVNLNWHNSFDCLAQALGPAAHPGTGSHSRSIWLSAVASGEGGRVKRAACAEDAIAQCGVVNSAG